MHAHDQSIGAGAERAKQKAGSAYHSGIVDEEVRGAVLLLGLEHGAAQSLAVGHVHGRANGVGQLERLVSMRTCAHEQLSD